MDSPPIDVLADIGMNLLQGVAAVVLRDPVLGHVFVNSESRSFRRASRPIPAMAAATAISKEQLKQDGVGSVVLQLKSPWRNGTTHSRMSQLEFMQRLTGVTARLCGSGTDRG